MPYGLAGWDGGRRLDFWQWSADQSQAGQIWLGHDSSPVSVVVGTFDPLEVPADSLELAEEMTIKLVNIGLPDPEPPRPAGFGGRLVRHAQDMAARSARWPTIPVTIEGQRTRLRYHEFAGAWSGCVDGYAVGVFGVGKRPDTLVLTRIADTAPYGFILADGVRFTDMTSPGFQSSAEDWHPDHRFLL